MNAEGVVLRDSEPRAKGARSFAAFGTEDGGSDRAGPFRRKGRILIWHRRKK